LNGIIKGLTWGSICHPTVNFPTCTLIDDLFDPIILLFIYSSILSQVTIWEEKIFDVFWAIYELLWLFLGVKFWFLCGLWVNEALFVIFISDIDLILLSFILIIKIISININLALKIMKILTKILIDALFLRLISFLSIFATSLG